MNVWRRHVWLGSAAVLLFAFLAPVSLADLYDYGWENGGTLLGFYGNVGDYENVSTGTDPEGPFTVSPHGGSSMLRLNESPHSGTPQGWVAFVEHLNEGEEVTASFWGWDSTPGASPSMRLWGHYALSGDINSYEGSAGGSVTYTTGDPAWDQVSWTWTFDSNSGTRDALVIEVRLYSTPSTDPEGSTDFWVDDLQVDAPGTATVSFAVPEPSGLCFAGLAALVAFRRLSRRRKEKQA